MTLGRSFIAAVVPLLMIGAASAAAQEHQPPQVGVVEWSLPDTPPPSLDGKRALPSDTDEAAFAGAAAPPGDFDHSATLAYRAVADGDVAGLALRGADGSWIGIQIEQITPALLVAVRSHPVNGIEAQGRLLATVGIAGRGEGTIRLRMERRGKQLRFAYATADQDWQELGQWFTDPTGVPAQVGVFVVDGAER